MPAMRHYTTTVKPGDTLSRIGAAFGVPWREIAHANGLAAPYTIHAGLELIIPGRWAKAPVADAGGSLPFLWVAGGDDDTVHAWRRKGGEPIRFLILHDPVAASVAGLLGYLRRNDRSVSYNDVVVPGSPPKVHTLSDPEEWVGHAGFGSATDAVTGQRFGLGAGGNLNHVSWGICLYKHRDDNGPFPADLYTAAVAVTAWRARQWTIDVRNVLSHQEVDPGRRRDPRGLDMARFRAHVADELARAA